MHKTQRLTIWNAIAPKIVIDVFSFSPPVCCKSSSGCAGSFYQQPPNWLLWRKENTHFAFPRLDTPPPIHTCCYTHTRQMNSSGKKLNVLCKSHLSHLAPHQASYKIVEDHTQQNRNKSTTSRMSKIDVGMLKRPVGWGVGGWVIRG